MTIQITKKFSIWLRTIMPLIIAAPISFNLNRPLLDSVVMLFILLSLAFIGAGLQIQSVSLDDRSVILRSRFSAKTVLLPDISWMDLKKNRIFLLLSNGKTVSIVNQGFSSSDWGGLQSAFQNLSIKAS